MTSDFNKCEMPSGNKYLSISLTVAFGVLLFALGLQIWEACIPQQQVDDAYITYRYAFNLAHGNGLVFNVGDRVEGITNLLWTLLLAAGECFGVASPKLARLLGAGSGATMLLLTWLMVYTRVPRQQLWLAGIAVLVLWASEGYAMWVLSGLETPLFGVLVLASFYAMQQQRHWLVAVTLILASLTRPEGVLLAAVIYGVLFLRHWRAPNEEGDAELKWSIFCYIAAISLLTLWRFFYYGTLLPNTFYAKVGGIPISRGFDYLINFLREGAVWLMLPVLVAAVAWRQRLLRNDGAVAVADLAAGIFLLLFVCYVVVVGGDVFNHSRFLLPVLPLLLLLASNGTASAFDKNTLWGGLCAACMVVAVAWPTMAAPTREVLRATRNWLPDDAMRAISAQLVEAKPPVTLVAAVAIGRIGYFSQLPILDLVGLVDANIARAPISPAAQRGEGLLLPGHQRSDPDYVMKRRPDFILIPRKTSQPGFYLPVMLDLWADPRLERDYGWNDRVGAYERRDRLMVNEP